MTSQARTEPAQTAVSYIRVSTSDQATRGGLAEGLSIPAQRQAITAKAQSVGAMIVEEFVEAGESGKSSNRPELRRMLEYLRSHRVDMVIVHKIDRLARNRVDDVKINLAIRETGAQLVSVAENVDETPQGQLVHGIFSSFAEFYSRNLATEVLKGMEQKVQGGGTLARAPIGYLNARRIVNGVEARVVELDPDRVDQVRWAFETYATNPDMTLAALTKLLNDRGLTNRASAKMAERPLRRGHVHRMLTNRYYVGYVKFRGVEYPGTHEPITDEVTFNAVQNRLASNRMGGNRERKHMHYLAGSLWCGSCGSRMMYSVNTGKHGDQYEYYICSGRHTKSTGCRAPYVAVERIESAVEQLWAGEHRKWQQDAIPELHRRLSEQLRILRDESKAGTSSLQRRLEKIKRDRYKWADHAMEGTVPADIAREKQTQLTKQMTSLEAELAALEAAGVDTQATLDELLALLSDPHQAYQVLSDGLRRTYNQAWFTKIYIEVVSEDPTDELAVVEQRSPIAAALDASRTLTLATMKKKEAGPSGPATFSDLPLIHVESSTKNPLVEYRRLELLTSSLPAKRSSQLS